jgi:NADH dehydrogenase
MNLKEFFAMKAFVTGATGFVGREILRQLLEAGHHVKCLVRPGSEKKLTAAEGLEVCHGDATDPASLEGLLQGCDGAIHLIGIIREFPAKGITFEKLNFEATAHLVRAAEAQGVRRFVHMSANGCTENSTGSYFRTKYQAEKTVSKSTLKWTIFRPSIIFGKEDAFVNLLGAILRKSPTIPVIGDGSYRLAPVAVEDVAACFVKALQLESSEGNTYHLCGPNEVTYNCLLDIIAEALEQKKPHKIHMPSGLIKPFVTLLDGFSQFPITRDQMEMLLAENICREKKWPDVFQIKPKAFASENLGYLEK